VALLRRVQTNTQQPRQGRFRSIRGQNSHATASGQGPKRRRAAKPIVCTPAAAANPPTGRQGTSFPLPAPIYSDSTIGPGPRCAGRQEGSLGACDQDELKRRPVIANECRSQSENDRGGLAQARARETSLLPDPMATLKELLRETTYECVTISSAEMFCWKIGGKGKAEGSPGVTLGARGRSRLKVEGRSFGHWVDSNQYTMPSNPRTGRVGDE
jgi:hypothetical protein